MIVASQLTTGELMSLLTYCMSILMNLMMVAMIFVMMTMSEPVQGVLQKYWKRRQISRILNSLIMM